MSADMIDVSLHLRVPARMTITDLLTLLERIAKAEGMTLSTKGGWHFYAELTAPAEPVALEPWRKDSLKAVTS